MSRLRTALIPAVVVVAVSGVASASALGPGDPLPKQLPDDQLPKQKPKASQGPRISNLKVPRTAAPGTKAWLSFTARDAAGIKHFIVKVGSQTKKVKPSSRKQTVIQKFPIYVPKKAGTVVVTVQGVNRKGVAGPVARAVLRVAAPKPGPDLVVSELAVNADCNIVATVKNVGKDPIPANVSGVVLQFTENGKALGGRTIASHDGLDQLRPPGGSAEHVYPTHRVASETIGVMVDPNKKIAEANESNNKRSAALSCDASYPDLRITSITTNAQCRKQIVLENVGSGPTVSGAHLSYNKLLHRKIDGFAALGESLATIDPDGVLRNPGGKVTWLEPLAYRSYQSFDYSVDYPWQEEDATNNRRSGNTPSSCQGTRPPFDYQPVAMSLDDACRIRVQVRKTGDGNPPPSNVTVKFYRDGSPAGSWTFRSQAVSADGSTTTMVGPSHKESSSASWRAVVDSGNGFGESNEGNNEITKTLRCDE